MLVTYTGKIFDYNNISKESIDIEDIIFALPSVNRFLGHSIRPYGVGEHTCRGLSVADKLGLPNRIKLYWLIHDFTEAYVGDCPTPLKKLLPEFSRIEKEVEVAILEKLGLPEMTEDEHLEVKRIDQTMLVIEMRDLTQHNYFEHINDLIYEEVIEDDWFKIDKNVHMDAKEIRLHIKTRLKTLLEDFKKGEI